ncbi:putative Protein OSCP1 [Paratrimastix pyriformis]|uniref:Uncharacterized protein n=1 Tax=Paratrimastix pyriformis TaxID=342808 RepID=A0ABQ8UR88_9EUKA|nr:putative Protein OSCP1 [Paratrimastix pyriformis]
MASYAMPFLVLNMGGEMVFILEQRLHAQNIPLEKGSRVLQEVIRAMCSPKFVEELFKPQDMYSPPLVRSLFERVAHSSIMRLNESSMDRLYDLMCMGFKHQVMNISHSEDLSRVTLNHLDELRKRVPEDEIGVQVQTCISRFQQLATGITKLEYDLVRQELLRFLQDKKVKVSLFLQEGIQNSDGTLVLASPCNMSHCAQPLGTVRYFDDAGQVTRTTTISLPPPARQVRPTPADPAAAAALVTCGSNIYATATHSTPGAPSTHVAPPILPPSKSSHSAPAPAAATPSAPAPTAASASLTPFPKSPVTLATAPAARPTTAPARSAVSEFSQLASLLGTTHIDKPLPLNIFPDSLDGPATAPVRPGLPGKPAERPANVVTIDAKTQRRPLSALLDWDAPKKPAAAPAPAPAAAAEKPVGTEDGDDLLGLMDGTA